MALLDIDEVDADIARAQRRRDVAVLQPIELRVGQDTGVVSQRRIMEQDDRGGIRPSPGMRQLEANQAGICARTVLSPGKRDQPFERRQVLFRQQQLAGVRASRWIRLRPPRPTAASPRRWQTGSTAGS